MATSRTVGLTHTLIGGLQSWLIQAGVTSGKGWKWRTVVSGEDADNDKDALSIAHDRYRAGEPSVFKKAEKIKKPDAAEEAA